MPTTQEYKDLYKTFTDLSKKPVIGEGFKSFAQEAYGKYQESNANDSVNALQEYLKQRAETFGDPNSKFYTDYRKNLTKTLSGANSTNALMAMVMAQGGSFAQAQEKIKALQSKINDAAISGTDQFYQNMQGQSNALSTTGLNSAMNMTQYYGNQNLAYAQLAEQKREFDESQPSFFDNLLGIGSSALGYAGGNLLYKWMR